MPAQRVISLIASATEIVAALGCAERLVGRSHECDFPLQVAQLPVCSGARIDVQASGGEIDRQVKNLLREGASIYTLDVEMIDALQPDLILTQSHCDVCAVSLADVENALSQCVKSQPRVLSLAPATLADVFASIGQVAHALGVPDRGDKLIAQSLARLEDIRRRAALASHTPSVACIEWIEPLMAGGNWVPELVEIAGGVNLFGEPGKHSPWMTWNDLVEQDPECIIILPCGWDIDRTEREMSPLTERPEWNALRAVRNDRVYLTDGNQYFNRPGPRLVESAEILAEIFHPETFCFSHEGRGWTRIGRAQGHSFV
jgi:iron complex transport system substrate-binding protein